jgi:hypothetical protein
MRIDRIKGLRPLPLFLVGLCLASSSFSQVLPATALDRHAMEDVGPFSGFLRSRPQPISSGPVAPQAMSDLAKGSVWGGRASGSLAPQDSEAFELALAGRWTDVNAKIKAGRVHPDVRDEQGMTLLTLAIQAGDLQATRALLSAGADVEQPGLLGHRPLALAAWRGHELLVRELLMAGADVKQPSVSQQTPLHLAAQMANLRVMAMLVRAGASMDAINRAGLTPLGEAARLGQVRSLAWLVESGVPPDQRGLHGLNALHEAALAEQALALAWLSDRGVPLPHPLTQVLIDTIGKRSLLPR